MAEVIVWLLLISAVSCPEDCLYVTELTCSQPVGIHVVVDN